MVFHRQFEAAVIPSNWTPKEKASYILIVLQDQAADVLHTVAAEAIYENIVGAFRDRFGDHQLAAVYRLQRKASV